jgi:hypothetical protein
LIAAQGADRDFAPIGFLIISMALLAAPAAAFFGVTIALTAFNGLN